MSSEHSTISSESRESDINNRKQVKAFFEFEVPMDALRDGKGLTPDENPDWAITELLKQEHDDIKRMLNVLDVVCLKLDTDYFLNLRELEQVIDSLTQYVVVHHNGKEEDLLYPEFAARGGERIKKGISELLYEHDGESNFLNIITEIMRDYRKKKSNAGVWLAVHISKYIALQKNHMEKEDGVIFPMIENYFSSSTKSKLLHAFERRDEAGFGHSRLVEFQKLLDQLEKIFINTVFQTDAETVGNGVYTF